VQDGLNNADYLYLSNQQLFGSVPIPAISDRLAKTLAKLNSSPLNPDMCKSCDNNQQRSANQYHAPIPERTREHKF